MGRKTRSTRGTFRTSIRYKSIEETSIRLVLGHFYVKNCTRHQYDRNAIKTGLRIWTLQVHVTIFTYKTRGIFGPKWQRQPF